MVVGPVPRLASVTLSVGRDDPERRSVLEQSLESDPWEGEPNWALGAFIRACIKGRLASVAVAVTPSAAGDLICGFPARAGGGRSWAGGRAGHARDLAGRLQVWPRRG